MTTADFWLDVVKALIGTAMGAGLAFGSNSLLHHIQRQRERYAAAVAAMEILRTQLDDFINYRKGFRGELAKQVSSAHRGHEVPEWAVARPVLFYFFGTLTFDYPALNFVLNHGGHEALARLRYAERRYHELANLAAEYNDLAQRKLERMSSKSLVGEVTIMDVENVVGLQVSQQLTSTITAIHEHLNGDERDYLAAESALQEISRKAFPNKPKIFLDQTASK